MRRGCERGSGTVLALGVIGVVVALLSGALVLGGVVLGRHRAEAAADLAALAGAVAVQEGRDGCAAVARVATLNGARAGCRVDGEVVEVVAEVALPSAARALAPVARARARAGPER